MDFDLRKHTHLLVTGGSRAYGMHKTTSDVDVKGICVPPKEAYFGNRHRFDQTDKPIPLMLAFLDFSTNMDDKVRRVKLEQIPNLIKDEEVRLETARRVTRNLSDEAYSLFTPEEREAIRAQKLEGTVFNLVKFIGLATEANPNIWDVLFCRDEEVRLITPIGRKLRENRHLFLSGRARFSFAGYAHAQLKRIRGHREYLLHPPDHKPSRAEFSLPENTLIPADHLMAVQAAVQKKIDQWDFNFTGMADADIIRVENQVREHLTDIYVALGYSSLEDAKWMAAARTIGLDDNLIFVMQKEREYEAASRRWKQYQDWRSNRNEARAALEAEHMFDTKHGAHLVRLLKMCREILTLGEVNVWRGGRDADDLLAIRNGEWTYEQVVAWAEKEDAELDTLYRSKEYVVPKEPDRNAIDALCVELVEEALANNGKEPRVVVPVCRVAVSPPSVPFKAGDIVRVVVQPENQWVSLVDVVGFINEIAGDKASIYALNLQGLVMGAGTVSTSCLVHESAPEWVAAVALYYEAFKQRMAEYRTLGS